MAALLLAALFRPAAVRADIAIRPVTSDFDAEFARAADLLEKGDREEGESVLLEIRRRANQRAWDARVALLLAADDERRDDLASAERRLRAAEAEAIGLEPYRRDRLAGVLEKQGRLADAAEEWRLAFASADPFARKARVGRELARALEKTGRSREALDALDRAATIGQGTELVAIELDRIRLGSKLGDAGSVAAAARTLLLRAPRTDVAKSTPPAARAVLRAAERRLSAIDRARRGRALVAAGDSTRGVRLLSEKPSAWPLEDRPANQLALARGLKATGKAGAAQAAAERVPRATPERFHADLLRADLMLARIREKAGDRPVAKTPAVRPVRALYEGVAVGSAPEEARGTALERLIALDREAGDFGGALARARRLTRETRGTVRGFEPVWELAWSRWRAGDFAGALSGFEALAASYEDIWRDRRLAYWRARALEKLRRRAESQALYATLVSGKPVDLYARFARRRYNGPAAQAKSPVPEPVRESAEFRRVDELLRLRMFEEASAEVRIHPPSRDRDLRSAEADFALGRFLAAAAAVKRAFPEIGTAEEGRVPDGWRRLHYPVEENELLPKSAREFRLDPAVFRGLVRQESVFDAGARSRAGAIGLTQLLPGTAEPLARSVLRVRYRRAFLYEPGVNARLGAAYFRQLLDRFGGNVHYALAAYNGGPTRMTRVLRENAGRSEDEVLESHPFHETRDYVRRVTLYAETYRELYPTR
ncbi:MAG TPA: lytic transglycosylase domain-containing protein [Thermoanaerobaculia bacterium]|nr:lytic transglycosylase domain-containing protein [Thermoanaerobaculia bacterium]